MKPLLDIIPRRFRAATLRVALSAFFSAVLNFAGLAVLLPVLIMVIDSSSIHSAGLLQRLYEIGGFSTDRQFTVAVCVAVLAVIAVKQGCSLLLMRVQRRYVLGLYRYFSVKVFRNYHDRGLAFIKRNSSTVLSRNVNYICYNMVMGVIWPAIHIASEILLLGMLLAALLWYDAVIALLAVAVFIPLSWFYIVVLRGRLRHYGKLENDARRRQTRAVVETFRGYADIEIGGAFPAMQRRFEQSLDTIARIKSRTDVIASVPSIITEAGVAVAMVALILWGAAFGSADIPVTFGIFAVAALRILPSVRSIMSLWWQIRYNMYTVEVVREGLEAAPSSESGSAEPLRFARSIDVRGLGFRFDDADEWTLRGIDLKIRKGEKVGIHGASGAGKTTLFNLLLGFYAPTEGSIEIDGRRLDGSLRRSWQATVGYVSQSVYIEDSTIAQNVALGVDPAEIDRERLNDALVRAQLSEFVGGLPSGADTPIGECGSRLSGGQRQRIGIARALYKRADVLFFDEATSSLDEDTERGINSAIADLSRDMTVVVIAHRSTSLDCCDRVIDI